MRARRKQRQQPREQFALAGLRIQKQPSLHCKAWLLEQQSQGFFTLSPAAHDKMMPHCPIYALGAVDAAEDGTRPFLVKPCDEMDKKLTADSTIQVFLNTFKRDFPETTGGKTRGRSSRPAPQRFTPLRKDVVSKITGSFQQEPPSMLESAYSSCSLFGYTPAMKYLGTEFNAQGGSCSSTDE